MTLKKLQVPEHYIQTDILSGLRHAPFVRFSQLKPKNIESNLFLYHMRQLIKSGLVIKSNEGYGLSEAGKAYMAKLSASNMGIRTQPTLLIVLCVEDPTHKKWLITRRQHQPFLGTVGFPSGKIHEGEQFAEAADREAREKLNLHNIEFTKKGVFEIRYWNNETLYRHVAGIVFKATYEYDPSYHYRTNDFESFWGEANDLCAESAFPVHQELLELMQQPGLFMESFDASVA